MKFFQLFLYYFCLFQSWSLRDKQHLLQKFAELFLVQDLVPFLVKHCKTILLEIIERGAQFLQQGSQGNGSDKERFCYTLSQLLPLSHLKDFIYRFIKASNLFSVFADEEREDEQTNERILCVLKTGYNLLCYDFETFYKIWDWSPVFTLLQHKRPEVRWYSLHIVAILTEMYEQVKISLLDKLFTTSETNSFLIRECLTVELSGVVQECLDKNEHYSITSDSIDVDNNSSNGTFINEEDFIGEYTTLCGVALPRIPGTSNLVDKSFVMVQSTVNNLHSLVLSVATGHGVLVEGPIGCGKTTLVEFVARATGRTSPPAFLKIQLGDQTDSKVSGMVFTK